MKIWIKYLIGLSLGIGIAFAFPEDSSVASWIITFLHDISIRFGKYSLFPFLFFTAVLGTYKLKENAQLFKTLTLTFLFIFLFAFLMSAVGLLSVLILGSPRVPIFQEDGALSVPLNIGDAFLRILPHNAFLSFSESVFILPIFIFATLVGASCTVDKLNSRPLIALFDSLSRLFYALMAFFVDMFAIALIAVSAYWMIEFKMLLISKTFIRFVLLLFIDFLFVIFVFYPIIIKITCRGENPYKIMYASIAPLVAAFFSSDANVTLNILFRHLNESLGVRRRITSFVLPIFSAFGRAGSALVITVSFLVVMTSYSSLGMQSFVDMSYLVLLSTLLSMCISHTSREGVYIAVSVICAIYGSGFESAFLIIYPAIFFMASIATVLDAITALVGTYIVANYCKMANTREVRFFI